MKLGFYILIILALNVLSIFAAYENPQCPEPAKNDKLTSPDKVLILFVIGFSNDGIDKNNIAYLLKQLACSIPTNPNIESGAFHTFNNDTYTNGNTNVKTTWKNLEDIFNEPNSATTCAKFGIGLDFLKTYQFTASKIKLIFHDGLMTGSTNCDHKKIFKDKQFNPKFELYQIKFSAGNDPNTMYYPTVSSIKTGRSEITREKVKELLEISYEGIQEMSDYAEKKLEIVRIRHKELLKAFEKNEGKNGEELQELDIDIQSKMKEGDVENLFEELKKAEAEEGIQNDTKEKLENIMKSQNVVKTEEKTEKEDEKDMKNIVEKMTELEKMMKNAGEKNESWNTANFLMKHEMIDIQKYSGEQEGFSTFIEMFESLIHKDKSLPNVVKQGALKALTGGKARDQVSRFPDDGTQYEECVEMLKKVFGNLNYQYVAIWNNIKNMKAAKPEISSCREVFNEIIILILRMERLGIETNQLPYMAEIKSKFPAHVIRELIKKERSLENQRFNSLQEMMKIIENYITMQEEIEITTKTHGTVSLAEELSNLKVETKEDLQPSWKEKGSYYKDNGSYYKQKGQPDVKFERKEYKNDRNTRWDKSKERGQNRDKTDVRRDQTPYRRKYDNEEKGPERNRSQSRDGYKNRSRDDYRNRSRDNYRDRSRDYKSQERFRERSRGRSFSRGRREENDRFRSRSKDYRKYESRSRSRNERDNRYYRRGSRSVEGNRRSYSGKRDNGNDRNQDRYVRTRQYATSTWGSNLLTARLKIMIEDKARFATVFLDTGSDCSFIVQKMAKNLKVVKKDCKLRINHFGNNVTERVCDKVEVIIRTKAGNVRIEAYVIDYITGKGKNVEISEADRKELKKKGIEDFQNKGMFEPDILIGLDYFFDIIDNKMKGTKLPSGMHLVETPIGNMICGKASDKEKNSENSVFITNIEEEEALESMFFLEETHKKELGYNDEVILEEFEKSVKITDKGIEVGWPWKPNGKEMLKDNREISYRRLVKLRETKNGLEKMRKIEKTLQEHLKAGYIEEITMDEIEKSGNPCYFMPVQVVTNENSETTRDRVVFDGSSSKKNEKSLNAVLAQGPVKVPEVQRILLKAKTSNKVLSSDIEKAYHQIWLKEEDRNTTCFFFARDIEKPITKNNIVIYRFTRIPFGIISSPFLLMEAIKFFANKKCKNEHVMNAINKSMYVDNLFIFLNDVKELKDICEYSKDFFSKLKMNLREYWINGEDLTKILKPEDVSKSGENQKILGYKWSTTKDTFKVKQPRKLKENILSKREAMGYLGSIFDPLGTHSPLTTEGKLLIPKVFEAKGDWSTKITKETYDLIKKYDERIRKCEMETKRIEVQFSQNQEYELHVFTDASEFIYGACAYLIINENGKRMIQLLASKQRLAGKKNAVTIPKLELAGITLGSTLADQIIDQIDLKIKKCTIHSDSMIALCWINNNEKKQVYVENRCKEIKKIIRKLEKKGMKCELRHVRTEDNPADLITRGVETAEELKRSIWFYGPKWLKDSEKSWKTELIVKIDKEEVVNVNLIEQEKSRLELDFTNSWKKAKNVFAFVLKFLKIKVYEKVGNESKKKILENIPEIEGMSTEKKLKLNDVKNSEKMILRLHQIDEKIIENQKRGLLKKENLVCRKTRLENALDGETLKFLRVIKPNSKLGKMIISQLHEMYGHSGVNTTMGFVNEKFYGNNLRRAVKNVLKSCVKCRKMNNRPYEYPEAPNLPKDRVTASTRAFENSAVDFCGPFKVRQGNELIKTYIAVFTCLSSRAVHLEVTQTVSTDEFLLAFSRFMSRRGTPKRMRSDNGASFVLTNKILKSEKDVVKLNQAMNRENIEWIFNCPLAPWQGGVFERMVQIVKKALIQSMGKNVVNYVNFETVVVNVERIINERPITVVSNDEKSDVWTNILRPAQLICPKWNHIEYDPKNFDKEYDQYTESYRECEKYVSKFWKVWSRDYVLNNEYFKKTVKQKGASHAEKIPEKGEIVLIKDEMRKRKDWRLGKIEEVVISRDKVVRSATVRTHSNKGPQIIKRPINKLIPLEIRYVENNSVTDQQKVRSTTGCAMAKGIVMTLMALSILRPTDAVLYKDVFNIRFEHKCLQKLVGLPRSNDGTFFSKKRLLEILNPRRMTYWMSVIRMVSHYQGSHRRSQSMCALTRGSKKRTSPK
ncbi:unnamed protein product [Caenorhabditis angaria]|uniref:Integrase catalytic domain-containing protein n=1 Tax=Caenorhabditis angaria TaxID=860376 RepID=A0A9P1IG46_9PELO|nr:unnamed protein product [Caenorhabditis angaria]